MKRKLFVPQTITVPTVAGDGIGKELMPIIMAIHAAASSPINFTTGYLLGQQSLDAGGMLIPKELTNAFTEYKILFKGPLATPKGKGHKSINLTLRDMFNLHTNFRPVTSLPGITTRFSQLTGPITDLIPWRNQSVDIVVFRENTEDLYKNTEEFSGENEDATITFKLSKAAARKILTSAAEYTIKAGRKKITFIHKSNIIKAYGLYIDVMTKEIAPQYPDLQFEEYVVDAYCEKVVMDPTRFDIVVAPNLFGDIVSDLHLGLIGGLGFGPGANLGDEYAMFEAIHGSADGTDGIAGKGIANPTGMLLSSVLMLEHVGDYITAERIKSALFHVLEHKKDACTPDCLGDVDKAVKAAHPGTTATMEAAIIAALADTHRTFNQEWLEASGAAVTA